MVRIFMPTLLLHSHFEERRPPAGAEAVPAPVPAIPPVPVPAIPAAVLQPAGLGGAAAVHHAVPPGDEGVTTTILGGPAGVPAVQEDANEQSVNRRNNSVASTLQQLVDEEGSMDTDTVKEQV
jgi:hypothetical protein